MNIIVIISLVNLCYSCDPTKVPFGYYERFEIPDSNFESIVNSQYFVDKTLLIKEFMNLQQPTLLSIPPRLGKTSNLDMLKRFFEISIDLHGDIEPLNITDNYKLFTTNYSKPNGKNESLNIYQDQEFFKEHFGQHPVILVDFASLEGHDWEAFVESFEELIKDVMREHDYLMQSELPIDKKEEFKHYIFCKRHSVNYPYEVVHSLSVLAKLLFERFEKKVILLIDNYDTPIQKSLITKGNSLKDIHNLIGHFTKSLVKDSPHISKALICTHSTMLKLTDMVYTDATNIQNYLFCEKHPFNFYYGLTDEEVEELAIKFGLDSNYMEIREWYNHYNMYKRKATVFNTFSVLNYLLERKFVAYWADYPYIPNLQKILLMRRMKFRTDSLFSSNLTDIVRPDRIIIADFIRMRELFTMDEQDILFDTFLEDHFLHYLLDMGYFTLYFRDEYHLIIETNNREIRNFFAKTYQRSMDHEDYKPPNL